MSILVDKNTRIIVQGITGREGLFHSQQMLEYGTQVVAGTRPGKGGEWVLDNKVPVFDSVQIAVEATEANTSIIFVPARFASDAILEAADAGVDLIVCLTEHIPVQDMMRVRNYLDLIAEEDSPSGVFTGPFPKFYFARSTLYEAPRLSVDDSRDTHARFFDHITSPRKRDVTPRRLFRDRAPDRMSAIAFQARSDP